MMRFSGGGQHGEPAGCQPTNTIGAPMLFGYWMETRFKSKERASMTSA